MIFRIYHETAGGHVHMRVFAGQREGAIGKCGDLCMRVEEFEVFRLIGIDGPAYACIDFQPEQRGYCRQVNRTIRECGQFACVNAGQCQD